MKRRFINKPSRLSRLLLVAFALFITFTMAGGGIYLTPSADPVVMAQDDPAPDVVNEPNTGTFSNTTPIIIPTGAIGGQAASPYPSTINVTGQGRDNEGNNYAQRYHTYLS